MATLFMLAADCETKACSEEFARYFHGKKLRLSDGVHSLLSSTAFEQDASFWVRVVPSGVGHSGVTPKKVGMFNELSGMLYDLLKTAPPFRFALVDVEAESYASYEQLLTEPDLLRQGLVVSERLWTELGRPAQFVLFAHHYKWIPAVPFELDW